MISVNTVTVADKPENSPESLKEGFKSLFEVVGKVRNKTVKLHVDPEVTPRQQPHRRIPFHVRDAAEKELERLERLDIIEKVLLSPCLRNLEMYESVLTGEKQTKRSREKNI